MKNKKVSKKELIKKHNNFVLHKLVFVIQKYKKRPNYLFRKLITYLGKYWILQLLINRINKESIRINDNNEIIKKKVYIVVYTDLIKYLYLFNYVKISYYIPFFGGF